MKNNAKISVKSMQDNNENDIIELVSDGAFYEKNGSRYIFYEEKEEMGMANCSVMIKIDDDQTVVTRKGDFFSKMTYKVGVTNEFLYNTPYGAMTMVLKTHNITHHFNEQGGELKLEYGINFQDEFNTNTLTINVRLD